MTKEQIFAAIRQYFEDNPHATMSGWADEIKYSYTDVQKHRIAEYEPIHVEALHRGVGEYTANVTREEGKSIEDESLTDGSSDYDF